ncbi:MAG: hypothetical protein ACREOH_18535 [Candidatus Entotheonellia bacterium]
MDPRLLGYNRRRQCQAQARRWRIWVNLPMDSFIKRGRLAQLARQYGVHRSTITRDMQAWFKWVRETRGDTW